MYKKTTRKAQNIVLAIAALAAALAAAFCALALWTDVFMDEREYASLVLYEGPGPVSPSETVSMRVDGHDLFVYETAVNNTHTWKNDYRPSLSSAPVASFDFEGAPVTMEIDVHGEEAPESALVRPLTCGIVPEVEDGVIRFAIPEPGVYTVEYNGSPLTAMHIFANAIDHDAPTESSGSVKYIGPGAWDIENIVLEDGMELYISGGAVVRGSIIGSKVKDVTISGHGFLDGSDNDSWMLNGRNAFVPVNLTDCENVSIQGLAMLDPNAWCVNIYDCDSVTLDGVKIITARPNGDGVTIQSCRDVTVKDSFVRSWDDSLVVKNYSSMKGSDSARITFDGCQIWTDLAQSMEIGYETNKGNKIKPTITDITFRNITVLHNFHKPVMSIHNADNAEVSAVRYENIVVEDASMGKGDSTGNAQFIDINNLKSSWTSVQNRGSIHDVVFDGIYVIGGDDTIDFREGNLCPIRIQGFDESALCQDITVNDLFILGQPVTDENVTDNPSTSIDHNTADIRFTNTGEMPEAVDAAMTAQDQQGGQVT